MRALLDLVAPTCCVACGVAADGELCVECARRVVVLDRGRVCDRCGGLDCAPCGCPELGGFVRARSLVAFAEPARSLTLTMKRRARASTIRSIGELLALLTEREGLVRDVVTFVPGGRAANKRGFDHARLLAQAVAEALDVPFAALLRRSLEGPRQADVPLTERRRNVAGRFAAKRVIEAVLLVDDVYTTGATAEACAVALRNAGATQVDVITWARTLRRNA